MVGEIVERSLIRCCKRKMKICLRKMHELDDHRGLWAMVIESPKERQTFVGL